MKKLSLILFTLLLSIHCGWSAQAIEKQISDVLTDYGLEKINAHFDREEIQRQLKLDNSISFKEALALALESFIKDGEDIESPKALLLEFAFEQAAAPFSFPYPTHIQKRSEELVKEFMLAKDSLLELQELEVSAENGESPEDYWIFRLYMGSLSDHQYWAIIDRHGNVQPYNYGFN